MTVSVFLTSQNHPSETRKRKRSHFLCVCVSSAVSNVHIQQLLLLLFRVETPCVGGKERGFQGTVQEPSTGRCDHWGFLFNPKGLVESTERAHLDQM